MAAQSGTVIFNHANGKHYLNIYFSDSAGAKVTYDDGAGAGATTSAEFRPPRAVVVDDIVLAAATGQTKTQINVNGSPTGTILLNALHLASVVNRPKVGVIVPAGSKLEMIQLA